MSSGTNSASSRQPSPATKPDTSSTSVMLTPSERAELQRSDKEGRDFMRRELGQKD